MVLRATQHYVEALRDGDSELRATQHFVEVAASGDSEFRVTQHYIEVLRLVPPLAENVMALTDLAVGNKEIIRSISHNLGITDQVDRLRAQVLDTMNIVDNVIFFHVPDDFKPISHTLNFVQTAISGSDRTVVHNLGLVETLGVIGPKVVPEIKHVLGMQHSASFCFGAPWEAIEISHSMFLVTTVGIGIPIEVSQSLGLTDTGAKVNTANHELLFVQVATGGPGRDTISVMNLSQQINSENEFGRTLTDDNIIQDAMAYYIESPCSSKEYNRFEGSGPLTGMAEAPLTFDADFSLETLSGPKTILSLRSPETDDRQRIGFTRINRETRGGELNVFADPNWPEVKNLLFTIVAISDGKGNCPDKLTELFDFMQTNLGLEIMIHDWEGISWKGIVTTPNEVAVEDRDGWWTFTFEFQGTDIDGSPNDQDLSIDHAVLVNGIWGRSLSSPMSILQTVEVSGIINQSEEHGMSITDSVNLTKDTLILSDNFSGSSGTDLHGQSPDVGGSTWAAHTNYKADGSQTAINSGAYYPFSPSEGTLYQIIWKPRTMTHSDGLASWFFLGEGLNADADNVGTTAWGRFDPTTLKTGFGIRRLSGTQTNTCRLGDATDGTADNVNMSDATLRTMTVDIDLRIDLDTRGGANTWTATWYAKDPVDSDWTEVRPTHKLLSEDVTMVGWSNDNTTTVVDMFTIQVVEKVSI